MRLRNSCVLSAAREFDRFGCVRPRCSSRKREWRGIRVKVLCYVFVIGSPGLLAGCMERQEKAAHIHAKASRRKLYVGLP